MEPPATSGYRFGDLLALARRSWIRSMAAELARQGYDDYRVSDAATMRLLLRGPAAVGRLGALLGVTRQAARKVSDRLERRGYAITEPDPEDGRKVNVVLTDAGRAYARAVVAAVVSLNRALEEHVEPGELAAADAVLRTVLERDEEVARVAALIPTPGAAR